MTKQSYILPVALTLIMLAVASIAPAAIAADPVDSHTIVASIY